MTDRYHSLTVVLTKDIRDDDAQALIDAILMLKGVLSVDPHVSDYALHSATSRVRSDMLREIHKIIDSYDPTT